MPSWKRRPLNWKNRNKTWKSPGIRQRESVIVIRRCANELLHVINDVLDFSKIEAGQLNPEILNCALEELLHSVVSMAKARAAAKGLEFNIWAEEQAIPARINTDPARVRQCLPNLLSNAIKFTEQGHVFLKISLQQIDDLYFICFTVEDTGIGISPEQQRRIFNSFTQADTSTTRKYGGTGLGLTITKQLEELPGGDLVMTSEPGQGSEFKLTLPIGSEIDRSQCLDVESLMESEDEACDALMKTQYSGRVLLVEDVPTNQKLIRRLLERIGLTVTQAEAS